MEKPSWLQKAPENSENTPETRKKLLELKGVLAIRARLQWDISKSLSDTIHNEGFRGETIQVLPDFKDKTVIYIKTSHAQIQIDLHYDESREHMDSLRTNTALSPEISITGTIDGEPYEINWYDEQTSAKIAGELLKQIERRKNPEIFWYTSIEFGILQDKTIIVAGRKRDGEIKRLKFFEFIDNEDDRIMLYGYISHFFWEPLHPDFFEEENTEEWWVSARKKFLEEA